MFSKFIEVINSDQGRLFKESKVKEFGTQVPSFVKLLNRTYSTEYVYGIKKVVQTQVGTQTVANVWGQVETMLDRLISRTVTGNAARTEVENLLNLLTADEAQVIINLLKGDLRCGISVATINKMFPDTIPEYPYMRCSLMKGSNIDNFDWASGIFSQEKADGMFANIFLHPDLITKITSRNGTLFANTEFRDFIHEFVNVADEGYCYHGELLVLEDGKVLARELGNGVLNSVLKGGCFEKNQKPFYMVWDRVPLKDAVSGGKCKTPYKDRFAAIKNINGTFVDVIPTKIVYSLAEAYEHYVELTSRNIEGTVIKNPKAIWEDKTSKDQIKLKIEAEVDLIVRGFNPGNGKNAHLFGSIMAESSDGRLRVNVSGISDKDRERINNEREEWIDKKIITVRANSIMESNDVAALFLPRLVEERLDKSKADDFEKIKQIFEEAKQGIGA
jgi:DNA ligase-1